MGLLRAFTMLTRWQKVLIVLCGILVVYTFLVFFVLPKIIQNISEKKLSEILGRKTTVSEITINPYSFLFILENLEIQNKNGDHLFFSIDHLKVNFQASSLFRLGPVIKEVAISDPAVHITRNQDGTYNFNDLLQDDDAATEASSPSQEEETSRPLPFFLGNISLHNGEIVIEDLPEKTTHTLTEMNLAIPFISNMDAHTDIFVTPYFAVNFNGAPFELQGKSKPFTDTLTTTMELNLDDLELPKYFVYNPVPTHLELADGKLSAAFSLDFSMPDSRQPLPHFFLSGDLRLRNLDIRGPGTAQLFTMDEAHLALSRSEILKGMINIDTLSFSSPQLSLSRDEDKGMNIYNLMVQDQEKEAPGPAKEKQEMSLQLLSRQVQIKDLLVSLTEQGTTSDIFSMDSFLVENTEINTSDHVLRIGKTLIDGGNLNVFRLTDGIINLAALTPVQERAGVDEQTQPEEIPAPWKTRLDDFVLQDFNIDADDLVDQGTGSISLEDIVFRLQQFSNIANQQGDAHLNFKINQSGEVDVSGKLGIVPLQADVAFTGDSIRIDWFQPFINEVANLIISDGTFSSKGRVSLKKEEELPVKAQLTGDINIAGFKVLSDHDNGDLFSFKNLALEGMEVDLEPFSVNLETVSLQDPVAKVIVSENGVLNFSRIAKTASSGEETDKPVKAKDEKVAPFKVDKLMVENGSVAVHDRSISPNFNTSLTAINSQVTGLSSDTAAQPDFKLNAMVNNHTPLRIDGKVNPLTSDLFLDMRMVLKDMDLGVFTPYAGKYAGYTIRKGKMTLDLEYLVDERRLNAKNDVFLDQFNFGKEVKSEDTVNAPVTLAVALLKDPAGRISLDLPIQGNLDDPEFSIGGVVVQMIMNLLVKAATAPFSLLGAMFGGGEDLNILEFEAGTATLAEQAAEKIQTLITALTQRPGLNLDIAGFVVMEEDRQALKQIQLERLLKSEKMKTLIAQGNAVSAVEDIQLDDTEYEHYLQTLFATTPQGMQLIANKQEEGSPSEKSTKEPVNTTFQNADPAKTGEQSQNTIASPTREEMLHAVMEQIEITDDDLRDLAQQRAMVVKDALTLDGGIEAARIQTTVPDTLEPQEESLRAAGAILTLQ